MILPTLYLLIWAIGFLYVYLTLIRNKKWPNIDGLSKSTAIFLASIWWVLGLLMLLYMVVMKIWKHFKIP